VIQSKNVLAVVPARAGSKGLPGKNLRLLQGLPLVTYPIRAALNSKFIDHVYCSTDSVEIANVAAQSGADSSRLRPSELAKDETSSIEVVLDAISYFESLDLSFDYLVMLEPTSPMTEAQDIDSALETLIGQQDRFENLITISESIAGHPQFTFKLESDKSLSTYNGSKWKFKRRQELDKLFFQTGSLYISEIQALKLNKSFVSDKTMGFEIQKVKSFEIDDLIDFKIVEMLMQAKALLGVEDHCE
jgi:N-acylneuraminate cytidylyltransferase/CMP-N,N'-diacetyllegionaminic acid synthase